MTRNHNYITPHILNDWPIIDDACADFYFDDYAATLARLVADKKTGTPLAIGVNGGWGSGKTTLLKRLRQQLDETAALLDASQPVRFSFVNDSENLEEQFRACRTVWFNTWRNADEPSLLVALLRVILQEIFRDDFIAKLDKSFWELFTHQRDVIETVLGWCSIESPFGETNLATGKALVTSVAEKTVTLERFNTVLDRLTAVWVNGNPGATKINPEKGVLVIFIDDLDRCPPEKIAQVLEAVNLFLDKSGFVFVIGADLGLLQDIVQKRYRDAGATGENAAEYIEKIIQLSFDLPPILESDMQGYIRMSAVNSTISNHWRELAEAAGFNPRKVKSALNNLQLRWAIRNNIASAGWVDFDDFVRWELLMRSSPKFKAYVHKQYDLQNPEMLVSLLDAAFRWASGEEAAAASFKEDLNEPMRRVLREIQPYRARFNAGVLKNLIYLTAPALEKVSPFSQASDMQIPGEVAEPPSVPVEPQPQAIDPVLELKEILGQDSGRLIIGGIEFIRIPAGSFLMGSSDEDKLSRANEKPQHSLNIAKTYWLAKFPLTNAQFGQFVELTGYQTDAEKVGAAYGYEGSQWQQILGANWLHPRGSQSQISGKQEHPVVSVTWFDAQQYCKWFNLRFANELQVNRNLVLRLPSESEWEKAARGEFGAVYPWGSQAPDQASCNFDMRLGDTTPVGQYSPIGDSPYALSDMAGNVWEWTNSLFAAYPYEEQDGREDQQKPGSRVVRGGSFDNDAQFVRCACRTQLAVPHNSLGFRVAAFSILS